MEDFSKILDGVPEYASYLSVEELNASSDRLAEEHSETVRLLDIGRSDGGEIIKCLKIGRGDFVALVYGFPNPEEPVGGLVVEYLSRALAEDPQLLRKLNYTWYLIKCIDPDGAKLNEAFLKSSHSPLDFAKNYYRTPLNMTGEENFPYRFGDLDFNNPQPETKALMKIMDRTRLDFVSSLHNMKWGGITYQVSEPCAQIYAPLQAAAGLLKVPLRRRVGTMLAPGIQLAEYFTSVRNYVKARAAGISPLQNITGAFVFEYAALMNPRIFMMIPECCLWFDPRCLDDRKSETTIADALKYASEVSSATNKFLLSLYDRAETLLKHPSPFLSMIKEIIMDLRNPTVNVHDPDPKLDKRTLERSASMAEKIETEGRADIYRMFNLGAMIRMFDEEISKSGGRDDVLTPCRAQANERLQEWNRTLEKKYECKAHSIKDLVKICASSILNSVEYVKWKTWSR